MEFRKGGLDVLTMGEPLAEFSATGRNSYQLGFSGDSVNVATSVSRLGRDSGTMGAVGDDYFGRAMLDFLEREHVTHSALKVERGGFTGIYFISIREGGEHTFTYYRKGSSCSSMRLSTRQLRAAEGAKIFHFSGIVQAIGSAPRQAAAEAAKHASKMGTVVSYDLNYRPALWGRKEALASFSDIAEYIDLLFVSSEDFELLYGRRETPAAIANHFQRMGLKHIMVKSGPEGSYSRWEEKSIRRQSFSVDVKDTTGAGDAFDAGFLVGLLSSMEIDECMRLAAANAALKCTQRGGTRGLPGINRVRKFLG